MTERQFAIDELKRELEPTLGWLMHAAEQVELEVEAVRMRLDSIERQALSLRTAASSVRRILDDFKENEDRAVNEELVKMAETHGAA